MALIKNKILVLVENTNSPLSFALSDADDKNVPKKNDHHHHHHHQTTAPAVRATKALVGLRVSLRADDFARARGTPTSH